MTTHEKIQVIMSCAILAVLMSIAYELHTFNSAFPAVYRGLLKIATEIDFIK